MILKVAHAMEQHTLQASVTLKGIGLHTGSPVSIQIVPTESPTGLRFLSHTSPGSPLPIRALATNVTATSRGTTLHENGISIHTVEHLLAALYSQGVDHADILMDGEELPIMDGSAQVFTQTIQQTGLKPLSRERVPFVITEPIWASLGKQKILLAIPDEHFRITFLAEYPGTLASSQLLTLEITAEHFANEIAEARTFALWNEVEMLKSQGLAKGGSIENAIVVYPDHYSSPLRFPDELVRHKILDLIGDLALVGRPVIGHFIAVRSGHTLNTIFSKKILEKIESEEIHA